MDAVSSSGNDDESSAPPLLGSIDRCDRRRIEGWAYEPSKPNHPVTLGIYCDGDLIGQVLANQYRPDLEAVGYLGRGCCSFTIGWPVTPRHLVSHVIEIRRLPDGAPLPGSPVTWEIAPTIDVRAREDIAHMVQEIALSASKPIDLDAPIGFFAKQIDELLVARARLNDGDRGTVVSLTRRWGGMLPTAVAAAAAPSIYPQVLFLDTHFPVPGEDAGSNAALDHMRALRRLGFQILFAATRDLDDCGGRAAYLAEIGVTVLTTPWYASIEDILRCHAATVDLVYLHRVETAIFYIKLVRLYSPNALIIYSVADLHHLRMARQSIITNRPEIERTARLLQVDELAAAHWADLVITHSSVEAELLCQILPDAKIAVIPWSVPLYASGSDFAERRDIAFVANFAHTPNRDALHYLCSSILPWTRKYAPEIKFLVYGSNMPSNLQLITQPNLEVVGYIDDLTQIYQSVRLTIAPLRFGAGIKGKVLESLAAGVPCIGTAVAYEGINAPAQLANCIAKTGSELCKAIVSLYYDRDRYTAVAEAGQRHALITYSEAAIDTQLRDLLLPTMQNWAVRRSVTVFRECD